MGWPDPRLSDALVPGRRADGSRRHGGVHRAGPEPVRGRGEPDPPLLRRDPSASSEADAPPSGRRGSGYRGGGGGDRKSTRLNSSHSQISYAVFCFKKKKKK